MIFLLLLFLFVGSHAWGDNWNWGPQQPPPAPNNNLAIGYPTAYGLYAGRGFGNNNYNGGGGPPNAGAGFGSPLRCLNGGAHIGQCRLDQDSICIALGGTCTHGACCTTPFVSMLGGSTTTTEPPEVIEGETTKKKKVKKVTTTTVAPEDDQMTSSELEEWNRLVERSKTTEPPEDPVTVTPYIEENRMCSSGLRSVGPCSEDADCPTLHQCENEQCCYLLLL
uniref:WAP domain-containing protein n=1 Tax=Caenorhabditis tropicalis TaxID=1561998 RepID=A0A1I7U425_9PELO